MKLEATCIAFSRFGATKRKISSRRVQSGRGRRRGTVAVFLALSVTVLLGVASLAVDYGVLLADKNHAQRAVDAAALAGAAQLKSQCDQTDMDNARRIAGANQRHRGRAGQHHFFR